MIKQKAKEITGEDIEIDVGEIDTDVKVGVNVNELARTEGIVSINFFAFLLSEVQIQFKYLRLIQIQIGQRMDKKNLSRNIFVKHLC